MSRDLVKVRTIRPHDTVDGMKQPGEVYDRTKEEADTLSVVGVVSIVAAKAKAKSAGMTNLTR